MNFSPKKKKKKTCYVIWKVPFSINNNNWNLFFFERNWNVFFVKVVSFNLKKQSITNIAFNISVQYNIWKVTQNLFSNKKNGHLTMKSDTLYECDTIWIREDMKFLKFMIQDGLNTLKKNYIKSYKLSLT